MTYSQSAKGKRITWERALQELDAHGLLDEAETFKIECWDKKSKQGTIWAYSVLRWLGY